MYCDGSLDEGEYTVEALMLSRVQGGSRKTFLVLRVSAILFLFWDPIFASMRVWFALFLFSDPGCSSLLALCQPFSILSGSGTHFFCSGTSPFPSISPGFQFVSRFFTHFSTLLHTFFTFIRYLNHCQEEIPIDTISFS